MEATPRVLALLTIAWLSACGEPLADRSASIVGGEPANGLFPAVGMIFDTSSGTPTFRCSGTLIAASAVLTAAHCADEASPQLGFSLAESSAGLTTADLTPVKSVDLHPLFSGNSTSGVGEADDIAILHLEQPATGTPQLLITAAAAKDTLVVDAKLAVVGSGATTDLGNGGVKHVGQPVTLAEVGDYELRVGSATEPAACEGDSGGAVLADIDPGAGESWRLVGVISRAANPTDPSCQQASIATRVDSYLDFIGGLVQLPCEDCADGGGADGSAADAAPGDGAGTGTGGGGYMPRPPTDDTGGCSCSVQDAGGSTLLLLLLLLALLRRPRSARR